MSKQTHCQPSVDSLFARHRAPFITIRDGHFHVGPKAFTQLVVLLSEVKPVRKFFDHRILKCYSLDCRTGKDGRLCELCSDRRACSRRLQLRLAYTDHGQRHPAILELPQHSFHAFDALLRQVGDMDHLLNVPIGIKPIDGPDGRSTLEFELLC